MRYIITYKDDEQEEILANSIQEAIDQSLMEEYIVNIEVVQ